ncbi:MAG: FHA domain-containing protein [Nannocystaceae bacterium]
MSYDNPLTPRWQLRVLNGPLRGTTHVLGNRTGIGRASSSDLQLIDVGISRQHAMIVRSEDGEYVLIDLASANGTLVDGERIDRISLRSGKSFTIVDTEVMFEQARAMRRTGAYPTMAPAAERGITTLRPTQSQPDAAIPAAPSASSHHPAGEVLAGEQRRPVTFEGPDGTEHGGLLIDDILEYRRLRAQCLRGGLANDAQRRHFTILQERLRQPPAPPPASQRAFGRFGCWFPGTLRFASGDQLPVWVRDFGVDGAQLKIEGQEIAHNSIVWLALELLVDGEPRSEVLAGRVAWTDGDFIGLAFTGPPRSEDGRYTSRPALREEVDDTRPIEIPRASLRLATSAE